MMPFLKSLSALLDEAPDDAKGATAAICGKPAMPPSPRSSGCAGCHFTFTAGRLAPPAANDDAEEENTIQT
ncbi:MAG: hypothetical protein E6Q98_05190 [Rhodospirillaceae bacterium]|nr:MAG: hypothetical protein E6Q98_05190 [Rhodospirillaceae bacterium]